MKINEKNLWQHIGDIVNITKDIPWTGDEKLINLKAGTYQIVEASPPIFFDIYRHVLVGTEPFAKETKFTFITTPPSERLELLKDALTKQILMLSSDGWEIIDEPNQFDMDITPYLAKLKVVELLIAKAPNLDE